MRTAIAKGKVGELDENKVIEKVKLKRESRFSFHSEITLTHTAF